MKKYDLADYVELVSQNAHTAVLKVKDTKDTKLALIANGFWGTETMFRITATINGDLTFEAFTSDNAYPKFINNDLKKQTLSIITLICKKNEEEQPKVEAEAPKAKRHYKHHKKQ